MPRPTIGQDPWGAALNADLNQIEENANSRISQTEKGATNGVAPLDSNGKLPETHVPSRLSTANLNSTYVRKDEPPTGGGGTVWYTGTGVPSDTTGNVDDLALDTSNGDYYKKTGTSTWSLLGNLTGPAGDNGNSWIDGTTSPTGATGSFGDYYLDTATNDYYKKTGASEWTLLGTIKGDQGLKGDTGPAGPPGPIGQQLNPSVFSGTYTLDPKYATDYSITIKGSFSLAAANMRPGNILTVALYRDTNTSYTVQIPSSWVGAQDITLSSTANHHDVLVVWRDYKGIHVKHVATGPLPAGSWDPDALPNKVAWFKADAITGVEENAEFGSWPNSYSASDPATGSGTPVLKRANNMAYVQIDGTDYFNADITDVSAPLTIALLVRIQQASGEVPVISGNGLNDTNVFVDGSTPRSWQANASGANSSVSNTNGGWEIVVVTINNASGIIRRNSTEVTLNTGGKGLTTVQIGRKNQTNTYGSFDLCEAIIINKVATSTEIADIEAYLGARRDILTGVV